MRKVIIWISGILLALLVSGVLLLVTGNAGKIAIAALNWLYAPIREFDPAQAAPAPDYAEPHAWAALPGMADPSDWRPAGVAPGVTQGDSPVDVFFVHPTGFVTGSSWTGALNPHSATAENTAWMLAHQASAFNGCCNLYAPHYRQASIFAYFAEPAVKALVMDFAYGDVVAAFQHYAEHLNEGRPFILASHSQGTHHSLRLLEEHIAGTPLAERLVAAWLIGGGMNYVTLPYLESLPGIDACRSATDLGCVIAWDTYADGGNPDPRHGDIAALCTNPLSWQVNDDLAPAELNLGAVASGWLFKLDFADDSPTGLVTDQLPEPLARHTWAQCRNGVLYVADQTDTVFAVDQPLDPHNLHIRDYSLFYMNIRSNAQQRAEAWLARAEKLSL